MAIEFKTRTNKRAVRFSVPKKITVQLGLVGNDSDKIELSIDGPTGHYDGVKTLKSGREIYGEDLVKAGIEKDQPITVKVSIPAVKEQTADEMGARDLHGIAKHLNALARSHAIGMLQELRAELKGLSRPPGHDIFSSQTTWDSFAFHHGGRTELQFNIGMEGAMTWLRHGVAFSFETGRFLPSIDVLVPKVKPFNDFMTLNEELFSDLRMWHFESGVRSTEYMPGPIPWERVKEGVFVFLGRRQPIDTIDYEAILGDLDRLLPLYKYVESGGASQPVSMPSAAPFVFQPGCSAKASSATATLAQRQLDITLRHNELEAALYQQLVSQYGEANVGTENPSGASTRVDVIVHQNEEYWFYEIKTSESPRACIREALGQLLEYAFWPGAQPATRLVVVGETEIDHDAVEYLRRLRQQFSLPIEYKQISVKPATDGGIV